MNILMITDAPYSPDIRIRREAEALTDRGFRVHVVCRGKYEEQRHYKLNGVDVTRICAKSKLVHYAGELIYDMTFYNPIWFRDLRRLLETEDFDVIYYHDIPPAKLATKLANQYGLPIVADLHEMYPQAMKMWRQGEGFPALLNFRRLCTPILRYKRLEQYAVANADGLITISDELLEYFTQQYDCTGCETGVVQNVPDLQRLDELDSTPTEVNGEFVVSYIGGFTPQRGIEAAIDAVSILKEQIPDIKLLLVGDGNEPYVSSLQERVERRKISDNVTFTGWIDFENVPSYYAASDVSIVPLTNDPESQRALPNKIFQAMAFQTPIVASDLPSMRRVLTTTEAGTTFDGTPEDLHDTILSLYYNPKERARMGKSGRKAVESRYNIESEIRTVVELLEGIK